MLRQFLADYHGTDCACPLKNVMQPPLVPIVPSLSLPCSESSHAALFVLPWCSLMLLWRAGGPIPLSAPKCPWLSPPVCLPAPLPSPTSCSLAFAHHHALQLKPGSFAVATSLTPLYAPPHLKLGFRRPLGPRV